MQRCLEVARRAGALLDRVAELPSLASPHLPAVQASALLLRMCGATKVNHLLRTTPPRDVNPAAAAFDDALLNAYVELSQLDT